MSASLPRLRTILFIIGILVASQFISHNTARAWVMERVSLTNEGGKDTPGGEAQYSSISHDGRFVTFSSKAENLVTGDTNNLRDIFVRDRTLGTTVRVNVSSDGSQITDSATFRSKISGDGRFVLFQSGTAQLAAEIEPGLSNLYRHEMATGQTRLITRGHDGSASDGTSIAPDISFDGRFTAFHSLAKNLVTDEITADNNVYVYDAQEDRITLVSRAHDGGPANGSSTRAAISADGRFVTFTSAATNLVSGLTAGGWQIYRYDRRTGSTVLISTTEAGAANNTCTRPSISGDGRFVAFTSTATNLAEEVDSESTIGHVYLRDVALATTTLVSKTPQGAPADRASSSAHVSPCGRYLLFQNHGQSNLYPGDDKADGYQAFIYDHLRNTLQPVVRTLEGGPPTRASFPEAIADKGRYISFYSSATNLVPDDNNYGYDVFVAISLSDDDEPIPPAPEPPSPEPDLARLQGMITDKDTNLPIHGVTILVSDGERIYTTRTDGFGMFILEGIEPGTYALEAIHSAYRTGSRLDAPIGLDIRNRWQQELELKEPFFDIFVEVTCVITGMQLRNVPVKITVTPTDTNKNSFDLTGITDEMGFAHFAGLPEGFFGFSINEGPQAIAGWGSYAEEAAQEIKGPHWADVLLKPETRQITASVYGFNPVTEEDNVPLEGIIVECEGVHPDDPDMALLPARTGVSGLRKEDEPYWDNTLAGKVLFTGLPPIHWIVHGKRLGYRLSESIVIADANAQLVPDDLRIDMALQNTVLTVVVDTPYQDPVMLDGLKVRLQGLKDSNTEGIDRTRTVEYRAGENRAVVVFDKILPGNYRATVDDMVTRTVPIIVDGVDIQAGKSNPSNRFSVRFTGADYLDAFADVNHETGLFLEPEPMTLTGNLRLSSTNPEAIDGEYYTPYMSFAVHNWAAKANQRVEIRASAYYADHMPEEYHQIEVTTDATGAFTVNLLPGLYGFAIPDLDDYWGSSVFTEDLNSGDFGDYQWPHHQTWPWSKESAESYFHHPYLFPEQTSGGIGGMPVSSGENLLAELELGKKQFIVQAEVTHVENNVTGAVVLNIDDETDAVHNQPFFGFIHQSQISLDGPETIESQLYETTTQQVKSTFIGTEPGSYTLQYGNPYFEVRPGSAAGVFQWRDFPNPGMLPDSEFPVDYKDVGVYPQRLREMNLELALEDPAKVKIQIFNWQEEEETGSYIETYSGEGDTSHFRFCIDFSHIPNNLFLLRGRSHSWTDSRIAAYGEPYTVWVYDISRTEKWYKLESPGGDLETTLHIGGALGTEPVSLSADYDMLVEARDIHNRGDLVGGVQVAFTEGPTIITSTEGQVTSTATAHLNYEATHSNWRHVMSKKQWVYQQGQPSLLLTLYMESGTSVVGGIVNAETGNPVPDAVAAIFYQNGPNIPLESNGEGTFRSRFVLNNESYLLDIKADGFEPYRTLLNPEEAVVNPEDPRTRVFDLTGHNVVKLIPLERPLIAGDSLTMNRRGAFLPGAKKAGTQSAFNAFTADGPLTMTWSLNVGLGQKEYTVTLPGFENDQTITLEDGVKEVWLVDMKSFPNNPYDDEAVLLELPEDPEPGVVKAFLANVRNQVDGFKHVYSQRLTNFDAHAADHDSLTVTGQVKLWQLPPDLFRPAFIVVTKLGAVNVFLLEYTGDWAGKELTGARLPPWLAGMADIMGSVAGSQALLGDGLMNVLPKGKIIALPKFTANIVLRATNTLDYVYSIDTQIKEGMQSKMGGVMGLSPGFMGLSLYGGAQATLKGEDREFYLQMKGGIRRNTVNSNDFKPGFLRKNKHIQLGLIPPPAGEFYHIDSYLFDPNNNPDELAVLYGVSGQTGVEVSASIFPVLKYIPKVGPIIYLLIYETGAMDVRGFTKGLVGVRSLSGFKTTFPRQVEHYTIQGEESKQLRRHFLGGHEVGDPLKARDPERKESLDIAFGFGVGLNVMAVGGRAGAKGTIEMAGDDSWTGVPAMLIDVNPNGDWPIISRIRGDLRAVLQLYLKTWIANYQHSWHWKAWPIDYQFGTESVMYLIEMEIISRKSSLGEFEPAEFIGEHPVIIDDFPPLGRFALPSGNGDMLIYTDMDTSGNMVLKASLRKTTGDWEAPTEIGRVEGVVVDTSIIERPGGGRLAVWTEIARDHAAGLYPSSTIMYATGNIDGTEWTSAAEAASLPDVAQAIKLIPHGDQIALIYTESREGPTGISDGLSAILWNGTAWSDPQHLTDSPVVAFEALGSDDLSAQPSLLAFTDINNSLNLIEWGAGRPSDPALIIENGGNAAALIRHNNQTWLAYSMRDGGIGFFLRDGNSGEWADKDILFPEAAPREMSMGIFREDGRDLVVVAWTESEGNATNLKYGFFDTADETFGTTASMTTFAAGDFRSPALRQGVETLYLLGVLERDDGMNQVHGYSIVNLMNGIYGDINLDGVVDLQDLIIILRVLVQKGPEELPGKSRADVTRTGRIDIGDAIHILRVMEEQ